VWKKGRNERGKRRGEEDKPPLIKIFGYATGSHTTRHKRLQVSKNINWQLFTIYLQYLQSKCNHKEPNRYHAIQSTACKEMKQNLLKYLFTEKSISSHK